MALSGSFGAHDEDPKHWDMTEEIDARAHGSHNSSQNGKASDKDYNPVFSRITPSSTLITFGSNIAVISGIMRLLVSTIPPIAAQLFALAMTDFSRLLL